MSDDRLDRSRLRLRPLAERAHRHDTSVVIDPAIAADPEPLDPRLASAIDEAARRVVAARMSGAAVAVAFGAHAIRNGLGLVLARLAARGFVTHLATNGAGAIHDWELAFAGATGEDVAANLADGTFGLWEETGRAHALALAAGAFDGLGYGASIGRLVAGDGVVLPDRAALDAAVRAGGERAAAAADLADVMDRLGAAPGPVRVAHPFRDRSLFAAAWTAGVPLTVHPGVGYDIVHGHPGMSGGALGRTAHRDFLAFAASLEGLPGGAYLSVGSAVMSPMVFEKALAMVQNVRRSAGLPPVAGHLIAVNDLAPAEEWPAGEPGADNPAYYLRFLKTFSRAGGDLVYVQLDNRRFLVRLLLAVERLAAGG
ncbi:MAG: hypothetical protein FJ087_04350 [Deltaproteobacteria bacterium]|nr:hypothetical protein [Deltaproteobacteria bacterium]